VSACRTLHAADRRFGCGELGGWQGRAAGSVQSHPFGLGLLLSTVWVSRVDCAGIFCPALPPGAGTAAQPGPSRPTCVPGGPPAPPRHARGETAREASTRQRGTRADAAGRGVMTSQSEFPLILRIDSAFLHACKNSESDGPTWAHSRGGGVAKCVAKGRVALLAEPRRYSTARGGQACEESSGKAALSPD
jgi:hypothetical protein